MGTETVRFSIGDRHRMAQGSLAPIPHSTIRRFVFGLDVWRTYRANPPRGIRTAQSAPQSQFPNVPGRGNTLRKKKFSGRRGSWSSPLFFTRFVTLGFTSAVKPTQQEEKG